MGYKVIDNGKTIVDRQTQAESNSILAEALGLPQSKIYQPTEPQREEQ